MSESHGKGEVGQQREVPGLLEVVEELDEPVELFAAHRVEVDHEQDAEWVLVRIEREDQLAELERCSVASSRADKVEVTKQSDEKSPENADFLILRHCSSFTLTFIRDNRWSQQLESVSEATVHTDRLWVMLQVTMK